MNTTSSDEIDLRPFLFSLLRRWTWVLGAAIVGAAVVAGIILNQPRTYEATALMLFQGERTQLALDERIVAEAAELSDRTSRRAAWIAIAQSSTIAQLLPDEVVQEVLPPATSRDELSDYISATTEGDLLELTATSSSAAKAQLLANAWSRAFVTHVNTLLSGNEATLAATQQQVAEAQERYEEAQGAFEAFLSTSRIIELDNRIASLSALLQGNLTAKQEQYNEHLRHVNGLRSLLQDAETLRTQIESGNTLSIGENLAAIGLRLRSTGGLEGLQFQVEDLNSFETNEDAVNTLDRLILNLQEQIETRTTRIAELHEALASNSPAPGSGLTQAEFEVYYQQLRELMSEREELEGQNLILTQERGVTLEALEVLQRKLAEQEAAGTQPDIEVVFAGEAPLPAEPANRGLVRSTIIGGVMGGLLGIVAALAAGLRTSWSVSRPRPVERAADTPSYS